MSTHGLEKEAGTKVSFLLVIYRLGPGQLSCGSSSWGSVNLKEKNRDSWDKKDIFPVIFVLKLIA